MTWRDMTIFFVNCLSVLSNHKAVLSSLLGHEVPSLHTLVRNFLKRIFSTLLVFSQRSFFPRYLSLIPGRHHLLFLVLPLLIFPFVYTLLCASPSDLQPACLCTQDCMGFPQPLLPEHRPGLIPFCFSQGSHMVLDTWFQ